MDAIEEVKNRLSIEDVIGEYIQLKRAGRNFRGLSPFNSEKTPSFIVSPEKQIWHDFSSNKGGNMFSFVMEMEGLDFKGALELLARKAGVDLEQYRKLGKHNFNGPDKERLYIVLEAAVKFYQVQLNGNKAALDYAREQRKFTKETIIEWKLGYSPNTGNALIGYLQKKGFSDQEIKLAGLSTYRAGRTSDIFRGRLMIPLQDPQGRVIGFTARQLSGDDYGPKYINTPQTVLYDKSRHVYGLHLAKSAIRQSSYVVICEGNLDVISSHQAGVGQVVATAGTALTEAHLKILMRFSGDIRLCFDGDKAGMNATMRAVIIASKLHISLNIIDIKDAKDPDELIKKDPDIWREMIENYTYAIDWLIKRNEQLFDLKTAEGKRHFTDELLPLVNSLDDPVEKDHYNTLIANKLNISKTAIEAKISLPIKQADIISKRKIRADLTIPPKEQIEIAKVEDHLLCLMLKNTELRDQLNSLSVDMLSRDQPIELLSLFKQKPQISEAELNRLDSIADYVKIESLQYEELYQGLEHSELIYEAARLQVRLIEQYVKNQKLNIAKQLSQADDKTIENLLEQARRLDELLRNNLEESKYA